MPLTLSTRQTAVIAATSKRIAWLFTVIDINDNYYYWSTENYTEQSSPVLWAAGNEFVAPNYFDDEAERTWTYKIMDFAGITIARSNSENGLVEPSDLQFSISNVNNTLTYTDFNNGKVYVSLRITDDSGTEPIRRWRFRIKRADPGYQKIRITCEDFLKEYLIADYPNTRMVNDLFPSTEQASDDNFCVSVPLGTPYIPLRPVFVNNAVSVASTLISAQAVANGADCYFNSTTTLFDGIELGRTISVSGFTAPATANNSTFLVTQIGATRIFVSYDAGIVTKAAGDPIVITHGSKFYVLGPVSNSASTFFYTVSEIRSPREMGIKSTWSGGGGTAGTFNQTTIKDASSFVWMGLRPKIADANNDGTLDSYGYWRNGESFLDMPTKFSRSDTSGYTSPADGLRYVLRDFGALDDDINTVTFETAKTTYGTWSLTWNGAFWRKDTRENILSSLLLQCHSYLIISDLIELYTYSKTSQKTVTKAEIMKEADVGEGSFRYENVVNERPSDSGYIEFNIAGEAQDKFIKYLVPAQTTTNTISGEVLRLPFVQDTQNAQRLGTLYLQRKLLKIANVSFRGKSLLLNLNPGDMITINHADYGGNYDVMVDSIKINKDCSIDFQCSRYGA